MPVTNAISERSFDALKVQKTWLRSTMQQSRINWYMILHHVYNDLTDKLDLNNAASEFVTRNPSTRTFLEKFTM